jgi:peptidoglycan/xylan/chitin deacetylase (PgdA/CDA1 family)
MRNYFVKTPNFFRWIYPKLVWSFSLQSKNKKEVYLTFDDGPTPEITAWTLDKLKQFNAKATFFCIGKNVKDYPKIFKKIINEGHSIGNHTHNHLNGWKTNSDAYIENVLVAESVISTESIDRQDPLDHQNEDSTLKAQNSRLFRPPYGKIKREQSKQLIKRGYKIIMWDVLSADFDMSISEERCLKNVIRNVKNGSVIIFHDSVKAQKNMRSTLPKVLEILSKKGYEFKAIAT